VPKRLLAVALLAGAVAAPCASAARVHVRVEGKTQTIFGATAPPVTAETPLEALEAASLAGEFYFHVAKLPFGPYVDQIGRYAASGQQVWTVKVNGKTAAAGDSLRAGDTVLWYWAQNGIAGGPKTLELRSKGGCYRVFAQDDAGLESRAPGAVLHVGGKTRAASFSGTCIGKHRGLVRATAPGFIRSNALP
jgi:hypothetical protein